MKREEFMIWTIHLQGIMFQPLIFRGVMHFSSWWFFTNPFEKYARQIGSIISPGFGVKIPKMFETATTYLDVLLEVRING